MNEEYGIRKLKRNEEREEKLRNKDREGEERKEERERI
jgi:hypothetical protein